MTPDDLAAEITSNWVTTREAAEMLGCNLGSLHWLRHTKQIFFLRLPPRTNLYRRADILKLKEARHAHKKPT